jgi:hypothetical protein
VPSLQSLNLGFKFLYPRLLKSTQELDQKTSLFKIGNSMIYFFLECKVKFFFNKVGKLIFFVKKLANKLKFI